MITTSYIYKNTKRLTNNASLLDVALECADFLDRMGASSFKNWLNGELVAGAEIKKYHVRTVYMFPQALTPDPDFIERLQAMNCIVDFKADTYNRVDYVRIDDNPESELQKKLFKHDVWLIEILIPIKYLALDGNTVFNIDGEDIEYDDIDTVYDSEATRQQDEQGEGGDEFGDEGGDDMFDFGDDTGGDMGDDF